MTIQSSPQILGLLRPAQEPCLFAGCSYLDLPRQALELRRAVESVPHPQKRIHYRRLTARPRHCHRRGSPPPPLPLAPPLRCDRSFLVRSQTSLQYVWGNQSIGSIRDGEIAGF